MGGASSNPAASRPRRRDELGLEIPQLTGCILVKYLNDASLYRKLAREEASHAPNHVQDV